MTRMPPAAPLVSLRTASVRFGDVTALREVTLTLHRGERLVLVGANGSGKTTLLRLLHGLIACEGRRDAHVLVPEGRAAVAAMLFQRPFLLSLSARSAAPGRSSGSAWPARPTVRRATSQADSSNAWRSRARGRSIRIFSSSMNRPRAWTRAPSARSKP